MLQLEDRAVRMDEARVGDLVRTQSGFAPILGFLHAEAVAPAPYLRISAGAGADAHSVAISALHHLYANGAEVAAAAVREGDVLETLRGPQAVTRVERIEEAGAYHLFVAGGTYFADGVLASDRLGLVPRAAWAAGRAYARARFAAGVPVVPVGAGVLRHAWLSELLAGAGVPLAVQRDVLFPLTVASSVLTELVNVAADVAAERAALGLGTAAAAALAVYGARRLARIGEPLARMGK